jgi:hypothetical protein
MRVDYTAYDLAVNMTDNLTEEQTIILQNIRERLQKCLAEGNQMEIVRMPLDVYKFCGNIFKRQAEVNRFLLQYFTQEFYLKDIKQTINSVESSDRESLSLYLRVLLACKNSVT